MNNIKVFIREEFNSLGQKAQNLFSPENIKYTINDGLEPLSAYRDPNGKLLRTITKKRSITLSGESNVPPLSIGINVTVIIEGGLAGKISPSIEFQGFAVIERELLSQMEMIVTEVKTIVTQAKISWLIQMEEL